MLKIDKRLIQSGVIAIFCVSLVLLLGQLAAIKVIETKNKQNLEATEVMEVVHPKEIIYVVKKGDSVFRIAQKYKVHRYQIRTWNNIDTNNYIYPGQQLIIKQVDYEPIEGLASWYGPNFHGRNMANGEVYDMHDIVVAHRTLPLGQKVIITNLENGRSIVAPVLDRGPYVKDSQGNYTREIDLSYAVAQRLGTIQKGVVSARIEPINEPLPQS
ncbi:septal ring lytic transglycosylase RlpA family protein [Candidatus Parcubacteria bacterium]|nr:septal ring lytic transglycosylase RlpA family protein [Candidatus Parcubacteria bacterium]